jgi:lactoylglutathione lyase
MINNLRVKGQITFFYYQNLVLAEEFYGHVMGFEKVIDISFAKVFKMASGAHVGIVGEGGYLKPMKNKPVMLTVIVEDVDAWYNHLTGKGMKTNHPPSQASDLEMIGFLTWDPEGYVIELLQFKKKPYG